MTITTATRPRPDNSPATTVTEGTSGAVLREIHRPDCAAAIWRRSPDARLSDWLDGLAPGALPTFRADVHPAEVQDALTRAAGPVMASDQAGRAALFEDVSDLAGRFAGLMRSPRIHLRLDAIGGNACSRFHQDYVPARLLCTYRGTGTEYGLVSPGDDGGNPPREISRMQRGWVGMFRGRLSAQPCGLVHRSPPIGGRGETRLLLVMDVAGDD